MDSNRNELSDLFDEYDKALPGKMKSITESWQQLKKNWDAKNFIDFNTITHNLHGSAGVYGYGELGKKAGKVNEYINHFDYDIVPSAAEIQEIDDMVSDLINEKNMALQKTAPKNHETKPVQSSATTTTPTPNTNNRMIYLYGNDLVWENELKGKLQVYDYQLQSFHTLAALIAAVAESVPLALLIDYDYINSPCSTGINDACIASAVKVYFKQTFTIFYSKNGDFNLRLQALKMGGKAYFVKPFDIDELTVELDNVTADSHSKLRVLIIDDDIDYVKRLSVFLHSENIENKFLTSATDIEKELHEFEPDLILSDLYMPECSGMELASVIRQQKSYENVPFIFISAEEDKQKQLDAMKVGADDFISKKTDQKYLVEIIKCRVNRYKSIKSLMIKDTLTGAFSRKYILSTLDNDLKKALQSSRPYSIAIVKINNLTNIRKKYGYAAEDQLFKNLYVFVSSQLDVSNQIGRYNDEYYIILFPGEQAQQVKTKMDVIRDKFSSQLHYFDYMAYSTTIDVGVAMLNEHQKTHHALIQSAIESLKPIESMSR